MQNPKAIRGWLAVIVGLLVSFTTQAQVNLKTGYNFSYLSKEPLHDLMEEISAARPYTSGYHNLTWLHGFEAGVRWKNGPHALELTYLGGYQHLKATGRLSPDDAEFKDKINFSVHGAGLGYQVSGQNVGIGAELQYQWYRTKAKYEQPSRDFTHTQGMLGYMFYGLITLPGSGTVDLAFKPYVLFSAKAYDSEPLADFAGVPAASSEKWTRIGISIIFYNGD